jgi:hypothetical protein
MTTETCRYFRTKKMYLAGFEGSDADETGESGPQPGHCWCNKTMSPVGEDDRLVSSVDCASCERACYQGR